MRVLLDTHTFLWLDNDPDKLSPKVVSICADPSNTLLLSVASIWEMQIKLQLGKLTLPAPLADIVANQIKNNQIELLSVQFPHVLQLANLPLHHKDPFDRLLIAQSLFESATMLTSDPLIKQYSVPIIWQ